RVVLRFALALLQEDRVLALEFGELGRPHRDQAGRVAQASAEAGVHAQVLVDHVVEQFVSRHVVSGIGPDRAGGVDRRRSFGDAPRVVATIAMMPPPRAYGEAARARRRGGPASAARPSRASGRRSMRTGVAARAGRKKGAVAFATAPSFTPSLPWRGSAQKV